MVMSERPSADRQPLRAERIELAPPWVGVEVHDVVGSTNAVVAARGIRWLAVTAEAQSQGRGRLDRSWTTTPGRSLAVSALLPPPALPGWVPLLTGLAVLRAVEDVCGLDVRLKWPNDVLCPADADRKLAGILCEWVAGGIVVGTGINVDQGREELPVDSATSLRLCGAGTVERERLLAAYLGHLAAMVGALDDPGAAEAARGAYRERCATIGREVVLLLPDGSSRTGPTTGVDDDGRLVLQTSSGPYAASAGDVVHVRTP